MASFDNFFALDSITEAKKCADASPTKKSYGLAKALATIIVLIILLLTIWLIYRLYSKSIFVETNLGSVVGISVNRLGKIVNCYYGVPYAEPPVGQLRFRKPVPKKRWKGVLKAVKPPPYCWQSSSFKSANNYIKKYVPMIPEWSVYYDAYQSEDCLYLNIYALSDNKLHSNRTVMVWIHGGSFQSGSASMQFFDGSTLAAFSDVIVVAVNYRLNIFGFMSADQPILGGNYGLYDQVLALEWIRDNIGSFGGNPNNVVLFGESAGGISVGYHLISPLSQNLFARSILQSGNAVTPIMLTPPVLQKLATFDVLDSLLCQLSDEINNNNSAKQITQESLLCLREANASELYRIYEKVHKTRLGSFTPIVDNEFFEDHPYDLVKQHKFTSHGEILIGSNELEGVYFAFIGPFKKYWSMNEIPKNFTKQTIRDVVINKIPENHKILAEIAIDVAFDDINADTDPEKVFNRYVKLVGDAIFVCSDFVFINEYSASNRSVYYYQFKPRPTFAPWSPKWAKGAIHGDEVPFVFGLPLIAQKFYTLKEIELSKSMMTMWTDFAKTGIPANDWRKYSEESQVYLALNVSANHMRTGFPGYRCDEYYDKLITEARAFFARSNNNITSSLID